MDRGETATHTGKGATAKAALHLTTPDGVEAGGREREEAAGGAGMEWTARGGRSMKVAGLMPRTRWLLAE